MATEPAPKKKRRPWIAPALIVVVAIVVVGWALHWDRRAPQTSDAQVSAETISVVPEVLGRIVELPVRDGQEVKKGDLLFRVDPRSYELQLAQAQAQLVALDEQIKLTQRGVDAQQYNADSVQAAVVAAQANAQAAADTLRRVEPLLAQGYASADEVDKLRAASRAANANLQAVTLQAKQAASAVSGVEALVAQRAAVQAQIALAELQLSFTRVHAPFDGRVAGLNTTVGQFASPAKPIFTLIATDRWYVDAQFRETVLPRIHVGDTALVYLMAAPDRVFHGTVESISYGVSPGANALTASVGALPYVQRSINWVHVAQRFPVRIRVRQPDPALFRVGTSALAIVQPQRGKQKTSDG